MTGKPPKKIMMNILEVLRRYSDENHRLSQNEIIDILDKQYDIEANRRSIRRNIMNLMDLGYEIEYKETIRKMPVKDKSGKKIIDPDTGEVVKEDNYIWSDYYLVRDFTDDELRLMIDGLLFSRHIPYSECKDLVEKIEGLSSEHFRSRVKYISTLPDDKSNNKALFLNVGLIDEAISKKRKITFKYLEYDTDKKMHVKKREDGGRKVLSHMQLR